MTYTPPLSPIISTPIEIGSSESINIRAQLIFILGLLVGDSYSFPAANVITRTDAIDVVQFFKKNVIASVKNEEIKRRYEKLWELGNQQPNNNEQLSDATIEQANTHYLHISGLKGDYKRTAFGKVCHAVVKRDKREINLILQQLSLIDQKIPEDKKIRYLGMWYDIFFFTGSLLTSFREETSIPLIAKLQPFIQDLGNHGTVPDWGKWKDRKRSFPLLFDLIRKTHDQKHFSEFIEALHELTNYFSNAKNKWKVLHQATLSLEEEGDGIARCTEWRCHAQPLLPLFEQEELRHRVFGQMVKYIKKEQGTEFVQQMNNVAPLILRYFKINRILFMFHNANSFHDMFEKAYELFLSDREGFCRKLKLIEQYADELYDQASFIAILELASSPIDWFGWMLDKVHQLSAPFDKLLIIVRAITDAVGTEECRSLIGILEPLISDNQEVIQKLTELSTAHDGKKLVQIIEQTERSDQKTTKVKKASQRNREVKDSVRGENSKKEVAGRAATKLFQGISDSFQLTEILDRLRKQQGEKGSLLIENAAENLVQLSDDIQTRVRILQRLNQNMKSLSARIDDHEKLSQVFQEAGKFSQKEKPEERVRMFFNFLTTQQLIGKDYTPAELEQVVNSTEFTTSCQPIKI